MCHKQAIREQKLVKRDDVFRKVLSQERKTLRTLWLQNKTREYFSRRKLVSFTESRSNSGSNNTYPSFVLEKERRVHSLVLLISLSHWKSLELRLKQHVSFICTWEGKACPLAGTFNYFVSLKVARTPAQKTRILHLYLRRKGVFTRWYL